jgi:CheY-like chemotaxis protein
VVEDEELLSLHLTDMLEEMGYCVAGTASTGQGALREAARLVATPPDLALVDVSLKGAMDGVDLAIELRRLGVPTLFLTGAWDPALGDRARPAAPLGHLEKPYTEAALQRALAAAIART